MEKNRTKFIGIGVALILLFTAFGITCPADEQVDGNDILVLTTMSYYPTEHDFEDKYIGEIDSTTFEIWRSGGCCSISYTLRWSEGWIDVFPTTGVSTGEHDIITVSIDTTDLAIGQHTGIITIDSNVNDADFTVYVNIIGEAPEIEIDIAGGTDVSVDIKNIGDIEITDLDYTVLISGGLFGMIDENEDGHVTTFSPGDIISVEKSVFGFGQITISVDAGYIKKTVNGLVLFFFVIISNS